MKSIALMAVTLILSGAFLAGPAHSAPATDRETLLALHGKVMAAHLKGNPDLLLEDESGDYYIVSGRGQISRPTLAERRARFEPYLSSTRFDVYRDQVEPVVTVSDDGSLGWVVVQIEARGTRTTGEGKHEPVEFVSSWIELYQKRDGRWLRVGNVSNFKP